MNPKPLVRCPKDRITRSRQAPILNPKENGTSAKIIGGFRLNAA